jgi:outer membrane protein TolC
MSLVVKKAYLARARYNLEFSRTQLKLAEERLAKKVISEPEIFSVRLNVERAEIEAERAEFDLLNAKRGFVRISGSSALEDSAIPDAIPQLTYSAEPLDHLLAGFLSQSDPPSLEAANLRRSLVIEDLNLKNQKTRLRPKFNLVAGLSQDEQSYTTNLTQKFKVNSIYGGISVNWTLFDGFASSAAVRNSIARIRQMENEYRDLTKRLGEQAQSQVKFLNFSARNMSITDRFVFSAEGQLKARQDDYARGVSSESDVSAAQLGLLDARLNAFTARLDYLAKIGDFLGTVVQDPVLSNLPAGQ